MNFLSNLKVRVLEKRDESGEEEPRVVFGDGTSSFYSTSVQQYAMTFEQEVPLLKAMSGSYRECFRFEKALLEAYPEGLLDSLTGKTETESADIDTASIK